MTTVISRFITSEDAVLVDEVLRAHWAKRQKSAAAFGEDYSKLWASMASSTHGGKMLRPALVLGVHEQLGGARSEAAVNVAVAFELLHSAFLLHDDVIDRDLVRRGQRNLAGQRLDEGIAAGLGTADSERWAQASAILAGDLLIHDAQSLIARLTTPDHIRLELLSLLDDAVFATAAGELADVALSVGAIKPVLDDVLAMTTWKTAPYSFAAPLRAGAVLAEATPQLGTVLARFGALVGMAFQLRDDVLGIFGDEAVTGKSVVGDAREGKMTAMMAFARSTSSWSELKGLVGGDFADENDGVQLKDLLRSCGALGYVEQLIDDTVAESLAVIDSPALPAALRSQLAELSHQATERAA